jgi:hypothetical protein
MAVISYLTLISLICKYFGVFLPFLPCIGVFPPTKVRRFGGGDFAAFETLTPKYPNAEIEASELMIRIIYWGVCYHQLFVGG